MFWKQKRIYGAEEKPRVPNGVRIYAIGDVHGRVDLLERAFTKIDGHLRQRPCGNPIEVLLGDYVDRGPSSAEVLDLLIWRSKTREMVFLRGNHEAMFLEFLRKPSAYRRWRPLGGLQTLLSYGVTPQPGDDESHIADLLSFVLPQNHIQFLQDTRTSFTCGDFFFAHAGVHPSFPISQQRDEDLMWIREEFLDHEGPLEKYIVHGHTPVPHPDLRNNRINIDTGAFVSGNLTVIAIEAGQIELL
jgi:serine/threonine protein phosphatase 1